MAKFENTKMTVTLDNDSKRILRNLTKAVDRLARSRWDGTGGKSGVKRLEEPAHDTGDGDMFVPRGDLRTEEYPTYQKYTAFG